MLRPRTLLDLRVGSTNDGLDLGAVDQPSDVGVGDLGGGEAKKLCAEGVNITMEGWMNVEKTHK